MPYREIGTALLSESVKQKCVTRFQRQMEQLGFIVTLQPAQITIA